MKGEQLWDAIIIGGSYAGLAAGMALGRALRKVLIIDSGHPCNQQTPQSHNFLTQDGKTPAEIRDSARQQVRLYDTVRLLEGQVAAGQPTEEGFAVQLSSGAAFAAKKLVFATGIKDLLPEIPGFAECWGISVLHCPFCHGFEVRGQKTGILANGAAGYELASLISNWTGEVTLYTNGPSTLTPAQTANLLRHRIHVIEAGIAALEHQKGFIQNIHFTDGSRAPLRALYARVPFAQHSPLPAALGCERTPEGYIRTDSAQRTTVPGVFACGDNAGPMRTLANAVAQGTAAGMMMTKELIGEAF
ncbi:MAG TPA: NAD(P)/FAD-dependent oxidoreductase [Chitinophagaceae bacterium]|jgi:thioredoxin reductase|nr:NAD(P)/FAD-dependent oxidoreductase [Chitinophagaceae bacterium]